MMFPTAIVAILLPLFALAADDTPPESSSQVVYGQLICYGDGFQKFLTGAKASIEQNFGCQECTGPTLTYGGVPGVYVSLSSREAHIFINGSLHQSLPLDDCSPSYLYHSVSNPERIWIQCKSSSPSYTPTYNRIDRSDIYTWTIVRRTKPGSDISYAEDPNNAIITGGQFGRWNDDIVVAMVRGRSEVAIFPDSSVSDTTEYSLASHCDRLTTLHPSQPYGESNSLQFVVDCVRSNMTKRWVITLDAHLNDHISPYQLDHANGIVSVTQDGRYFFTSYTSQVVLVGRFNTSLVVPAVSNFDSVITGVQQVRRDLLIESPGKNRTLINVTEFTSSTAIEGLTTLPHSEAYCPLGVCTPSVVIQDKYLVVFVKNGPYLDALAYDLDNPQSQPLRGMGRLLATTSFPQICFFQEGDTPLFERILATPAATTTTSSKETDQTLRIVTTTTSHPPSSEGIYVGVALAIVAGVIVVVILIAALFCVVLYLMMRPRASSEKNKEKCNFSNTSCPIQLNETSPARDTEPQQEIKIELKVTPFDAASVSDVSSGVPPSLESSRMSTPRPKSCSGQYFDPTHLVPGPVPGEQTSDYSTGEESSVAPSLSPSPEPRHRQRAEGPDELDDKAYIQQDYSPNQAQIVLPPLVAVPSQLQPNSNSVQPGPAVQEESQGQVHTHSQLVVLQQS